MSLLPSRSEASPPDDAGPRVIGVESDDADDVLSALSSTTARELLAAVHDDPAPPAELAERVETSLQNAQYHLEKLEDAGAIEVVDTAYSEKGREMDVYAPSDQPLVIFAGEERDSSTLQTALSRLLGAVGVLALGSLVVQAVLGTGSLLPGFGGESGAGDQGIGAGGAPATQTPTSGGDVSIESVPTEVPQQTVTPAVADTAQRASEALPPGVLFFAGGLVVIAVIGTAWYLRR